MAGLASNMTGFSNAHNTSEQNTTLTTQIIPLTTEARDNYYTGQILLDVIVVLQNFAPQLAYAVGLPGSVLTAIILIRMRPFNSSSVWLLSLSILDFIAILARVITTIISIHLGKLGHDVERKMFNTDTCKLYFILLSICEYSSYMMLVGMTVERLIAVWFPFKMSSWCTIRKAIIAVVIILLFTFGVSSYHIHTMIFSRYWGQCLTKKKYRVEMWRQWKLYGQPAIMYALPMVSLMFLNILIFARLAKARSKQKEMAGTDDQAARDKEKQQKQINRMLLAATVWFMICGMPHVFYHFTMMSWRDDTVPYIRNAVIFCENFFPILRVYNHAGNFILYVFAAKRFRSECFKIVTFNKYKGFFEKNDDKKTAKK